MTEEELREEATSTVEWECTPMIDRPLFVFAYVKGALLREKQIAELEKENVELKEKVGKYQIEMFDEIEKRDRRITKAKEIICEYVRLANLEKEDTVAIWQLYHEAEQFLREVSE